MTEREAYLICRAQQPPDFACRGVGTSGGLPGGRHGAQSGHKR